MKTYLQRLTIVGLALALAGALTLVPLNASAFKHATVSQAITEEDQEARATAVANADEADNEDSVVIEKADSERVNSSESPKEVAWLGVSTTEASEALTSQLDLQPGVGLVVTYVAPDGPAAKAGLKKHDVLVQLEDQSLVHPSQLRKLVRVRKEGDTVKLTYYRAGKQKATSVTLGKTTAKFGYLDNDWGLAGNLRGVEMQLRDLHLDEAMKEQMKAMHDSLGAFKLDQGKVQEDIRRSMNEARKALHEALHNATNADPALNPIRKAIESLVGAGMVVDNNATVVVRNSRKDAKSLVQTDDSGTIVLVNRPKLHLTAHDKDGNLVFDGEIETSDQRAKVPRNLWKRVEPLVEKLNVPPTETRENSQDTEAEDKQEN